MNKANYSVPDCREDAARQYILSFLQDLKQLSIAPEQAISMIKEVRNEHIGM